MMKMRSINGGLIMSRFIPSLILVLVMTIAAPIVGAQVEDEATYPDFEGIWEVEGLFDISSCVMAIWQANEKVWGYFGSEGEIGGYINEDGRLVFMWEFYPDGKGTGWVRTAEEGEVVEGIWSSDIELSEHGSWDGVRIGPNNYEVGDKEALNYDPSIEQVVEVDETDAEDANAVGDTAGEEIVIDETDGDEQTDEGDRESDEETQPGTLELWPGTWDTDRGFLVLAIVEGEIVGTFGENGVLQGTVEGNTLSGEWSDIDAEGNASEGDAVFWLAEDGLSFRGTYNNANEPDLWLVWSGELVLD